MPAISPVNQPLNIAIGSVTLVAPSRWYTNPVTVPTGSQKISFALMFCHDHCNRSVGSRVLWVNVPPVRQSISPLTTPPMNPLTMPAVSSWSNPASKPNTVPMETPALILYAHFSSLRRVEFIGICSTTKIIHTTMICSKRLMNPATNPARMPCCSPKLHPIVKPNVKPMNSPIMDVLIRVYRHRWVLVWSQWRSSRSIRKMVWECCISCWASQLSQWRIWSWVYWPWV